VIGALSLLVGLALAADQPYVHVIGVAQDAGHPQAGCDKSCCQVAWEDPSKGHLPASLAIVDGEHRWIIDATPDIREQLHLLGPAAEGHQAIDGILLTHAHMGHYTGLMHLGKEVMGTQQVPVYVMPRMSAFLQENAPWGQLVDIQNISLRGLTDGATVELSERVRFTAFAVPHRDEYSETVGYIITGPGKSIAWLPDIDKWERWSTPLEDLIAKVDVAYLDGTFYADGELGERDMSQIPHPFIAETMSRLAKQPAEVRAKVRFMHLNHTNPALDPNSEASAAIRAGGFHVAVEGEKYELGP